MADSRPYADAAYPDLVFDTLTAYRRSAALKGAIDLDLFTGIAEGCTTVGAIATRCQASERGVRMLCDCLVVMRFLDKDGDRYALTPTAAAFLDRRSPRYMGGFAGFLNAPAIVDAFDDIAAVVRKGGTVLANGGTLAREHPVWMDFARSMAARAAFTAEPLAALLALSGDRTWKVLDVAASHGLFGIVLMQHFPTMTVVALDWPEVLEIAEENARAARVADRFAVIPGDALSVELGKGYDLVLLMNFLHHFDVATCERLLRRVHAALAPGGRAVTLDFIPDENRVSPPTAALFNLTMLATTPAGEAHTFGDYERMFGNAGFGRSEIHPLHPTPQRVIVSFA